MISFNVIKHALFFFYVVHVLNPLYDIDAVAYNEFKNLQNLNKYTSKIFSLLHQLE